MKSKKINTDIAIVGGGIVGLLSALALAKLNYKIIHIEKSSYTKILQETRSIALSYYSIAILNSLGVWNRVKDDVEFIKTVHVSDKGHLSRAEISSDDASLPFLGVVIKLNKLLSVTLSLLSDCINVQKSDNTLVKNIYKDNELYSLDIFVSGTNYKLESKLILACDGARSKLREKVNISSDIINYNQSAMVFDIELKENHNNKAYERFCGESLIAMLPLAKNKMSCVWVHPTDKAKIFLELEHSDFVNKIQQDFGYKLGGFVNVKSPKSFPLELVHSQKFYNKNLLIFGNALHFLHPVSAQGLNLSIRDIGVLFDLVKNNSLDNLERTLKEFKKLRREDHSRTIKLTNSFLDIFASKNPLYKVSRGGGLHFLQRSKSAKRVFSNMIMGKMAQGSSLMQDIVE